MRKTNAKDRDKKYEDSKNCVGLTKFLNKLQGCIVRNIFSRF